MNIHGITRTLFLLCLCLSLGATWPTDTGYLSRGTVYFPQRGTPYFGGGSVFLTPGKRRNTNQDMDSSGSLGHICVYQPNFYCLCTPNGVLYTCENHTSSFFKK